MLASRLVNGVTIIHEPLERDRFRLNQFWFNLKRESPSQVKLEHDFEVEKEALSDSASTDHALGAEIGRLDYYQIEFASHDCVIAEGVWAESYADAPGLRAQFHNAAEFFARYPDEAPPEDLTLCAPRPERGAKLEAALRHPAARAAAAVIPGPLEGFIDTADAWHIHGWALDTAYPNLPVLLDIRLDDEALGDVLAVQPRDDLRAAGKGAGNCAFSFTAPRRLPADALSRLTVRRVSDGAPLPLSFEAACRPAAATPTSLRIVA